MPTARRVVPMGEEMSDVLITADEHYGHENIIEYCDRPFKNTTEMQEVMIARHNAKVPNSKNFLTIHAGDMFWDTVTPEQAIRILDRLHGRHAYLYGNHEKATKQSVELKAKFDWMRSVHELHFNKKLLWISHYSHEVWPGSHKGSWHVYGHSHGELEDKPNRGLKFDIGVDKHNFEPWTLEEIAREMTKRTCNHIIPPEKRWPGKPVYLDGFGEGHGPSLT